MMLRTERARGRGRSTRPEYVPRKRTVSAVGISIPFESSKKTEKEWRLNIPIRERRGGG